MTSVRDAKPVVEPQQDFMSVEDIMQLSPEERKALSASNISHDMHIYGDSACYLSLPASQVEEIINKSRPTSFLSSLKGAIFGEDRAMATLRCPLKYSDVRFQDHLERPLAYSSLLGWNDKKAKLLREGGRSDGSRSDNAILMLRKEFINKIIQERGITYKKLAILRAKQEKAKQEKAKQEKAKQEKAKQEKAKNRHAESPAVSSALRVLRAVRSESSSCRSGEARATFSVVQASTLKSEHKGMYPVLDKSIASPAASEYKGMYPDLKAPPRTLTVSSAHAEYPSRVTLPIPSAPDADLLVSDMDSLLRLPSTVGAVATVSGVSPKVFPQFENIHSALVAEAEGIPGVMMYSAPPVISIASASPVSSAAASITVLAPSEYKYESVYPSILPLRDELSTHLASIHKMKDLRSWLKTSWAKHFGKSKEVVQSLLSKYVTTYEREPESTFSSLFSRNDKSKDTKIGAAKKLQSVLESRSEDVIQFTRDEVLALAEGCLGEIVKQASDEKSANAVGYFLHQLGRVRVPNGEVLEVCREAEQLKLSVKRVVKAITPSKTKPSMMIAS